MRSCLLFCTTRCLFLLQDSPCNWQNFCYNYTRAFCRLTVSTPAPASMRCISVVILFGVCDVIAVFAMFARLAQVGYVVIDSQPLEPTRAEVTSFCYSHRNTFVCIALCILPSDVGKSCLRGRGLAHDLRTYPRRLADPRLRVGKNAGSCVEPALA